MASTSRSSAVQRKAPAHDAAGRQSKRRPATDNKRPTIGREPDAAGVQTKVAGPDPSAVLGHHRYSRRPRCQGLLAQHRHGPVSLIQGHGNVPIDGTAFSQRPHPFDIPSGAVQPRDGDSPVPRSLRGALHHRRSGDVHGILDAWVGHGEAHVLGPCARSRRQWHPRCPPPAAIWSHRPHPGAGTSIRARACARHRDTRGSRLDRGRSGTSTAALAGLMPTKQAVVVVLTDHPAGTLLRIDRSGATSDIWGCSPAIPTGVATSRALASFPSGAQRETHLSRPVRSPCPRTIQTAPVSVNRWPTATADRRWSTTPTSEVPPRSLQVTEYSTSSA